MANTGHRLKYLGKYLRHVVASSYSDVFLKQHPLGLGRCSACNQGLTEIEKSIQNSRVPVRLNYKYRDVRRQRRFFENHMTTFVVSLIVAAKKFERSQLTFNSVFSHHSQI